MTRLTLFSVRARALIALTTVFSVLAGLWSAGALTPMAFAVTGGGAFISQPLALVVIGGLVSSTAPTLIPGAGALPAGRAGQATAGPPPGGSARQTRRGRTRPRA